LNTFESPTGMASSLIGTVNLTVTREVAISFAVSNVSFTNALTGQTRDSIDNGDIQTGICAGYGSCGLNITNDGSVTVNISLQTTKDMFSGTSPVFQCNLSNAASSETYWHGDSLGNASMQDCSSSAGAISPFIANLSYKDPQDWAMIDFKVTVPVDEPNGLKYASVSLTAVDAELA